MAPYKYIVAASSHRVSGIHMALVCQSIANAIVAVPSSMLGGNSKFYLVRCACTNNTLLYEQRKL